mgnify:CR=1 FL=1
MQRINKIIIISVLSLVLPLCFIGKKWGQGSIIPEAIEDHTWAISVAISDLDYGLHQGYVYYHDVFDCLNAYGMTKYPHYLEKLEGVVIFSSKTVVRFTNY